MALGQRRVMDPTSGPPGRKRLSLGQIPWVAGAVLVISVLVFAVDAFSGLELLLPLALHGPAVAAGQWYRVLTTVVVHGSPFHIFFNMMVLWSLGIQFERAIGTYRFLLISLITALGSAAFVLWLAFDAYTVGASGMILGWAGAMLSIATAHGRKQLGTWLVQIGIISALPLIFPGLLISWQGHLGGFLFGLASGMLLRDRARHFKVGAPLLLLLALAAVFLGGTAGLGSGE